MRQAQKSFESTFTDQLEIVIGNLRITSLISLKVLLETYTGLHIKKESIEISGRKTTNPSHQRPTTKDIKQPRWAQRLKKKCIGNIWARNVKIDMPQALNWHICHKHSIDVYKHSTDTYKHSTDIYKHSIDIYRLFVSRCKADLQRQHKVAIEYLCLSSTQALMW